MTRNALAPLFLAALFAAPLALAAGADTVMVMDASVRAVPPGQNQTAAYLTLHNRDTKAHALVKAASPAASVVELHTVVKEGGMMKMRPVARIDVGPGARTELKPGGLHIMLIGLKAPLKAGGKLTLTLTFEDGSSKQVSAPVTPVQAGTPMGNHQH